MGRVVEYARVVSLTANLTLTQYHEPQACGATVVLEWRE
jgi:hypothetical protein